MTKNMTKEEMLESKAKIMENSLTIIEAVTLNLASQVAEDEISASEAFDDLVQFIVEKSDATKATIKKFKKV